MTAAAILGCAGTTLAPAERAFFARVRPWGFILFSRNVADADQVRRLCAELRQAAGHDAPVFVDQEGGSVQRLRPPLAHAWPDAAVQHGGLAAIGLRHRLMAAELRACGIDGNCAPVIDVAVPQTHPFLARRIWPGDAVAVAAAGRVAAEGLLAGGVLPVIKHLPGHGAGDADSHHALPRVRASLDELSARDFLPVRALADLPLGMSAHVVFEALDPDRPATLSPVVLTHLRQALGFDGLLMTDDICMNALGGAMDSRAAQALRAGCDIVLHCSGDLAEMEAVAQAVPPLAEAALRRAQAALAARRPPEPIDFAGAWAEFERLTGTAGA
ncbi:MAG: glycoside hydrolase family 3 protein [Pararhodobacter sp.]|nr:glycoside hydrolase family 3 protein [Pararhodobacter sp.]